MNTREELSFVESLISAFSYLGVKKIPFANDKFKKGVTNLKNFIYKNFDIYERIVDIETLFVESPYEGDFVRLKKAFEFYNGTRISFILENPRYEIASINTPSSVASNILGKNLNGLPKDFMISAAQQFCIGAAIEC